MAHMLQALKNLEARGVGAPKPSSPAARVVAALDSALATAASDADEAHDLPTALVAEEAEAAVRVRPVRRGTAALPNSLSASDPVIEDAPASALSPIALGTPEASAPVAAETNPFLGTAGGVSLELPALETLSSSATGPANHDVAANRLERPAFATSSPAPPPRASAALERLVRRTLSDPVRSQPLVMLAERLERDVEQTGSRTLLFVGVGPDSAAQESLLHAAPLLTERLAGDVLLVDADLPRRALTEGLEFGQQPGFSELLRSTTAPGEWFQPTSFERLYFLPAGRAHHFDLSTSGPRLEQLLEELATRFSCVLIDGGRTGELAAGSLARVADAAYFVVQLGAVETSTAQAALRDFRAAGARVLGSIAT